MSSSTPVPVVSRFRCFADSRAMARNPVQVLSRYNKIFGDTFRLYLGGLKEAIVTIDPAVIQHVLCDPEGRRPRRGVALPPMTCLKGQLRSRSRRGVRS